MPIWRRVEVPSTLMLDQVHDLLQMLFGWYDSHLHRFALGSSVWDRDAELFLSPFDVEDGDAEGTPESEVRLDETMADPGAVLRYTYDFGDDSACSPASTRRRRRTAEASGPGTRTRRDAALPPGQDPPARWQRSCYLRERTILGA